MVIVGKFVDAGIDDKGLAWYILEKGDSLEMD
jgi:hypothetical protein